MENENIEVDLQKEERTIWQEPQDWDYENDGLWAPKGLIREIKYLTDTLEADTVVIDKNKDIMLEVGISHDEFKCKCNNKECAHTIINRELLHKWYMFRVTYMKPVKINSGFRCMMHNKSVGGSLSSYHTKGMAIDIAKQDQAMTDLAKSTFPKVIEYDTFLHLDVR